MADTLRERVEALAAEYERRDAADPNDSTDYDHAAGALRVALAETAPGPREGRERVVSGLVHPVAGISDVVVAGPEPDEREALRRLIDDEVLTRTARSVGDLASGYVADAVLAAGFRRSQPEPTHTVTAEQREQAVAAGLAAPGSAFNPEGLSVARGSLIGRAIEIGLDAALVALGFTVTDAEQGGEHL